MNTNRLVDLIIRAETDGLDDEDEVYEFGALTVMSGLVNSTGSYQRFVAGLDPDRLAETIARLTQEDPR